MLLMLFTDVGHDDAPTRIRIGSHHDVARSLIDVSDDGVTFFPAKHAPEVLERPVVAATGRAGDVFICHPFLVHAASWPHRGTTPRVIGQPCIHHVEGEWLGGFDYTRSDVAPVELAMRAALGR